MTARVVAGLRVVQVVAARADPTLAVAAGVIARAVGLPLSSVSRLCAELVDLGLLARGEAYGSYRVGYAALALSGRAAAPFARAARTVLTRIAQSTGESALLAASTPDGMRVIGAVTSPWTLHSPATVGELVVDPASAIVRAGDRNGQVVEAIVGKCVELAVPVLEPGGEAVAIVAVRLPVNRAKEGVAVAHRAAVAARRTLEHVLNEHEGCTRPFATAPSVPPKSALAAAQLLLEILATSDGTVTDLVRATGLRRDRLLRLVESCRRAGFLRVEPEGTRVRLDWSLHGWMRAASGPTLARDGAPIVADVADRTGVCAFITVLRGMRSVTLVEELRSLGPGLEMTRWLGRPCPILSSDGGPALVMDFDRDAIAAFLPKRTDPREAAEFFQRVETLAEHGVIAREAFEEAGQTAFAAPIRDSSGAVVAAACLVGATDEMRPRIAELSTVVGEMAADLSGLVGGDRATGGDAGEAALPSRR
ncbi:helix-turn-helix domain-containing protein [Microbacterium sp. HD4P20]|uniref:IclR family transcriptional regulator domain-containing protein n=1 Tax=Microbacterium sp. HD4P20 TaxID=2864874 RepID=UPI0020A57684|nr:helix-turn-helix domain-containing protein [Microbacterium sp. HD4P20]MCP2635443.1 helix-turn-helix domain-containing protein [Microbacterium sp. HD4P20]